MKKVLNSPPRWQRLKKPERKLDVTSGWVGVILKQNIMKTTNKKQNNMQEVDSRYMMSYSHLCDELGNSPVVCLDPFTGWHVVERHADAGFP